MYMVVEFTLSNEIAVIPNEWLPDSNCALWLPYDSGSKIRITAIESAHPDSVVIVLGDFNYTNLKKFLPRYKQHVNCATRNNKTLDHCYTVHKNAYNALVRAPLGEKHVFYTWESTGARLSLCVSSPAPQTLNCCLCHCGHFRGISPIICDCFFTFTSFTLKRTFPAYL